MIYTASTVVAVLKTKKSFSQRLALLLHLGLFKKNKRRRTQPNRKRSRGWALQEIDVVSDAFFQRMFRMDRNGFNQLLSRISPRLPMYDERMAINSSGSAISKKTRLACTLRWLAGGSYIDI